MTTLSARLAAAEAGSHELDHHLMRVLEWRLQNDPDGYHWYSKDGATRYRGNPTSTLGDALALFDHDAGFFKLESSCVLESIRRPRGFVWNAEYWHRNSREYYGGRHADPCLAICLALVAYHEGERT